MTRIRSTKLRFLISLFASLLGLLCLPGPAGPAGPGGSAASAQTASSVHSEKSGSEKKGGPAVTEIRAVLDAQVAAWNAGKLEEFMEGYWRSPELTFFSGGRKLAGWDAMLDRYRKSYQAEGKEMGRLEFSDLEVLPLSESSALVRGRWKLTLSDGKEPGGLYTLLFRRFKEGWKIVHDHTSANQ
ncbi:MAG TPA: nuclear transport factor 2 family protein [Blastocatellia bacterium]|nr:nuclear transport factor 2 family protein [Blastocatellia bacterium]